MKKTKILLFASIKLEINMVFWIVMLFNLKVRKSESYKLNFRI